jgi:uncharacterized damage-inducible protein DinB
VHSANPGLGGETFPGKYGEELPVVSCGWLRQSFGNSHFPDSEVRENAATVTGGDVDEKALFTNFWTQESKTTSKVLSRIPEGSDYRPDPKSRTAQEIAWQIVCEEKMIIEALENGKAEWAPPPAPATMKEILDEYDRQSAAVVERWNALPEERWNGTMDFFGGQRPASPMAWSFLFDIVHHRGQISTYLRPMGSKVPQIYGPSGDEP